MPELPEVEVTRRSFADRIAGAQIESVTLGKPLRWPLGLLPQALVGRGVLGVRRRGKYLLLDLSEGLLLMHLGMSGSLRFVGLDEVPLGDGGPHDHFDLQTSRGLLRLHDPRRFGAVIYVPGEGDALARKLLDHLGMEPLSEGFTLAAFRAGLAASRSPIKQLLLGGSVVVGVGNIYASEVLFLSRIHPATPARDVGPRKVRALYEAIRAVLALAVEKGGTTLRDFSAANGMEGHFQLQAQVYGREGQPCTHCGAAIRLMRQGQRSTYYCARCQKAPKFSEFDS
ncbi:MULTISPECIES: bifunctional DNA-formamidopyrimidine glycosylase/DNA-(apurinic or apyrimidinic site) lyase [Comamonas]|jgi:formamidopyrimidine-DNA glycosylase|uniref:bifunctional DNA-formamidopyrimidine glycosylase/DNA-(apurinic or apyrimidinic site) lyase n=1 Tax=Comamonas TaxID=283 RepID=UPI0012CD8D67|nr:MULTISPECIES: bifunctional DNA-formamidopyrimidine glycosylase/DNA-(apurinic or apyrimidinic site) lyase [Comamonas]MDR3064286.1 bifunctional DNA-formamidopyrimidine glycosylase/DNA-(apurinic or apyrimidinic site) lyase [Comamonas sp.]MEB5965723.1 bifunctional DNA-formamidopyrimidine glycosylase/DNA-(apurinic or apyrimidinic site) lyase [Comamonas testosteroni]MPS95376.1 bifunctional DNA-formamidopyrimidine glycosylase/DNA-(apurinic or apyrimidinic site) lyase [Comamonas sp.]